MTRKTRIPDFEKSLRELEQLVEKLEQGDLPLDDALKAFERGVALTRGCQSALQQAQSRVEILSQRNGTAEIEPFEDDGGEVDADEDEDDSVSPRA